MLKILKEIINEVYIEFDKKIEGRRLKEFDKDGITVYVHQFDERMTITALKIDTPIIKRNQILNYLKMSKNLFYPYFFSFI